MSCDLLQTSALERCKGLGPRSVERGDGRERLAGGSSWPVHVSGPGLVRRYTNAEDGTGQRRVARELK